MKEGNKKRIHYIMDLENYEDGKNIIDMDEGILTSRS